MVLKLKTYNYRLIKLFFRQIFWPLVTYLNIFCKKPINLPLKTIRFTVKTSNHVTSKPKEHFEIQTYTICLNLPLRLNLKNTLAKFKLYLISNLKTGINLQILKKF